MSGGGRRQTFLAARQLRVDSDQTEGRNKPIFSFSSLEAEDLQLELEDLKLEMEDLQLEAEDV